MLPACKEQAAFQSQSHTRAASGTQPGPGLVLGTRKPTHVRRPLGLPPRYTAASNSCTLYGLLLRAQFGFLLQQLLLGAQIGLTHACARSFSSSCELRLSWLSQNACKDAREQEKRRKLQHGQLHCGQRFAACPKKMREQFCESGSTFGSRFGTQFWLQFWPPFFQFVW